MCATGPKRILEVFMEDLRHHRESVPLKGQRLLVLEERQTFSSSRTEIQRPLYYRFPPFSSCSSSCLSDLLLCTYTSLSPADRSFLLLRNPLFFSLVLVVSSGDFLFVLGSRCTESSLLKISSRCSVLSF